MISFELTNEKIYLCLFIAIGITIFFMTGSWYVKSCVKDEIDLLKRDNRRKKKALEQSQAEQEQMMLAQQKIMDSEPIIEPDMDSYMDPVGRDSSDGQQYKNLEPSYPSPSNNTEGILMRDIADNKAFEHQRSSRM